MATYAGGRLMAGWDELLKDKDLPGDVLVYGYRGEKYAIESAGRKIPTVMVPGEVFYMDWWQADIDLEPYAMGGYSPLYKVFSFDPQPDCPEDIVRNEKLISSGTPDVDSVSFLHPGDMDYIAGVQGCLWTECISTAEQLEYMMFPRFLAIAEKGWSPAGSSGWEDFKRRITAQRDSLAARGINAYGLHDAPIVSAKAISGSESEVSMACEQYGAEIRYSLDGGDPGPDSALYTGPFVIRHDAEIRAGAFFDGKLKSYIRKCGLKAGQDKDVRYPTRWPW